ncbi:LORF4 protein [Gallid alphaherpesvirus 3]|uniref:LORF4 protein n=1 Tax=Gallid alphaherpesvirus 3 TaxID=35250 RepID=F8TC54_9ALPH|nr:LORF4 protein [Gallid alphaherpesvirus 3]AEI00265.1 LORF4 protein [Gallid alphaherpesvirus 3]QEY02268.1 LORF4 protein [Gallid alphaherpesvirus 3]
MTMHCRPQGQRCANYDSTSDAPTQTGFPMWLTPRELSPTNVYGIVARPVLLTHAGGPINSVLTGGWKGRMVTATSSICERILLWVADTQRSSPSTGSFDHAWFLAVGTPWFLGRNILPKELLWFLTDRCRKEVSIVLTDMPMTLKTVFRQFHSNHTSEIKPALLMNPRRFTEIGTRRKTIYLCESAMRENFSTHGMLISCVCDRPGGLQCLSFIRILENLFNEVIGSPEFAYLDFKCDCDGLFPSVVRAISGPSFSYSVSKAHRLSVK